MFPKYKLWMSNDDLQHEMNADTTILFKVQAMFFFFFLPSSTDPFFQHLYFFSGFRFGFYLSHDHCFDK